MYTWSVLLSEFDDVNESPDELPAIGKELAPIENNNSDPSSDVPTEGSYGVKVLGWFIEFFLMLVRHGADWFS